MTAHYNAPDRPEDLEAAFHSFGDAKAYADEYGGTVTQRGVAFVVSGYGVEHDRAKADLRKLQEVQPLAATVPLSELDAAITRAVQAASDRLRAEFEAERVAFLASQGEAKPTPVDATHPTFTPPAPDQAAPAYVPPSEPPTVSANPTFTPPADQAPADSA